MFKKEWIKRTWIVLVFITGSLTGIAQTSIVTGVVRDAKTNLPLPSVTITIKNVKGGVVSDSVGNFTVKYDKPFSQLVFSIVGYKDQTVNVKSQLYTESLLETIVTKKDTVSADSTMSRMMKADSLMHNDSSLHLIDSNSHNTDTSIVKIDSTVQHADSSMNKTAPTATDENLLVVLMQPNSSLLKSVTVKSKRTKYRNKDNPAVELIRKVIDNKSKNKIEANDYAQYEKYEKMQISIDNLSSKVRDSKLTKKYHFLFENADTTTIPGKALLPVYLEEKISHDYFRANPQKSKSIVVAHKRVDFGEFVDMHGVSNYLNRLYAEVNIYDNNIPLFTNLFLSPIADMSPTFYMFFISDTVVEDGQKFVRLTFRPRNPNDFLFRGTLYVTLDGNYAVQKFTMFTSKNINLNFVRELRIAQDFIKQDNGRYLLSKSTVIGDLGVFKKGTGVFGQRTVSYKDFAFNQPIADSIFKGPPIVDKDPTSIGQDTFWQTHRHDTLSKAESKVYANIDSLKNMPSFRRLMDWATLLLAGYKQAGPFEIGPASTFYSFNPVEGFRLRFGGRTTPKFSNRMYFEGYGAYGFKDEKWKYFASATYSINNKSVYGFPLNYVRVSYQHETKIPGQDLQFVQEDNFLLSFKRGPDKQWLYNDYAKLNYVYEFGNHFSYDLGLKYWKQYPADSLFYVQQKGLISDTLKSITTGELSVQFRWAPNEQFYQGKLYRIPIFNKYPVFTFRYVQGVKGLFGGQYNYQNLTLNIFKRFYLSQLGYTDVTAEGGYIFGKVPFALMAIAHANQTYGYQLNSYNMMNFLEFVGDHYVSLDVDHYFNGFIFNKIPLLKKLKWREVIEGKLLWGGVRSENDPSQTADQIKYPALGQFGAASTYPLGSTPYIEAGFGIANIFKLVRLDAIRRITYMDHSSNINIPTWGLRVRVKFDF